MYKSLLILIVYKVFFQITSMEVIAMGKQPKTATNNAWCGNTSNEGVKYFHDKAQKSATNNQWVSTGVAKGLLDEQQ